MSLDRVDSGRDLANDFNVIIEIPMHADAFSGNMAAQEVMLRAAPGLATICVTTAVGLVCSMLVKAQLVNLDYVLPR